MKKKIKRWKLREPSKIVLFYFFALLTIAWLLLIGALLVVWQKQPICPSAALGPPKFPVFLFVFIGGFIVFCFGGLFMAYKLAFSD